jgi:hypothetical protein
LRLVLPIHHAPRAYIVAGQVVGEPLAGEQPRLAAFDQYLRCHLRLHGLRRIAEKINTRDRRRLAVVVAVGELHIAPPEPRPATIVEAPVWRLHLPELTRRPRPIQPVDGIAVGLAERLAHRLHGAASLVIG